MNKARKEVELLIYKTMDILDPTEANSGFWKEKFAKMNDKEFYKFFEQEWPLKFQMKAFDIEPKMEVINKALNFLKVPLSEYLYMPFMYEDKGGKPVRTVYKAIIVYCPIKKMKQFIGKKNNMSLSIDDRNLKTGRLIGHDKSGQTSDREFEALVVMSCPNTLRELATYRADATKAKDEFYNEINTKGMVSLSDVSVDKDDSIARNTLSVYFWGAGLHTNLVSDTYYTPYTLKKKDENKRVKRES